MAGRISHPELLRLLDYDPETGIFRWKAGAEMRRVKAGEPAGALTGCAGYVRIRIFGVVYLAHRLAWFYAHSVWPETDLDHRDTDRANNAIANLRPADAALNGANKRTPINNTSGAKGVRKRANNRWRASIERDGKFISLGTYGSREEASAAYLAGAQKLFGEFARAA